MEMDQGTLDISLLSAGTVFICCSTGWWSGTAGGKGFAPWHWYASRVSSHPGQLPQNLASQLWASAEHGIQLQLMAISCLDATQVS